MKGKRKRESKQRSPLARDVLRRLHPTQRCRQAAPAPASATTKRRPAQTESTSPLEEPSKDEVALLQDLEDELTPGVYRSYLPCRLLDTLPVNCVSVHQTEQRYCKVAFYRFMHQVEKRRKSNSSNKRLGVDGTSYVTWQFMPQDMVREKRRLGDSFFDEVAFQP